MPIQRKHAFPHRVRGVPIHALLSALAICTLVPDISHAAGDAAQGAQIFRNCAACHSLEPGMNMTGPSLAGIFGRKAGSLASFHRYSDALKRSGLVWDERTLDAWIRNPAAVVPGNEMAFPGIPNAAARANLIAYLHEASVASQAGTAMQARLPDLKSAPEEVKVTSIGYCGDTYTVATASGRTRKFWEFNLRFKTDSSRRGPRSNEPVLVPQGMQGDRAQVVFSSPDEIAKFVKSDCAK